MGESCWEYPMLRFREDWGEGMRNPTFEDKRRVLELLPVQVTVKDKKAQVRCLVPVNPSAGDHSAPLPRAIDFPIS